MRVLVTGTSGFVGAATAREFLANGWTVRAFDRGLPPEDLRRAGVEPVYGDLTDRLALLRAAEGCDAVAHLAAITSPGHSDDQIFPVNVTGTQNVLAAAEAHGIQRVALASTCCVFGIYFALNRIDPQYLPMDEAHPDLPQDLYGLSKLVNEETAAAYSRRTGMSTICLRLTTVMGFDRPQFQRWFRRRIVSEERNNDLWSYIEVRDAARAFRLGVEADLAPSTHETVIIAARDAFTSLDIRDLVRKNFPALAEQVADLAPALSLYDTRLAEATIGFVAQHNWRDIPDAPAA